MGQGEGKLKAGASPPSRSFPALIPAQFQVLEEPLGKGWNSSSSWAPQIRETGAAPASLCPSQLSPNAGIVWNFRKGGIKAGITPLSPRFGAKNRDWGRESGSCCCRDCHRLSPRVTGTHLRSGTGNGFQGSGRSGKWRLGMCQRGRGQEGREGRIFQLEIGKTWRGWEPGTSPLGCWSRPVPVPRDVPVVIPGSQMCPGLPELCP